MDFSKISPMVSLENVCFSFVELGAQNNHLLIGVCAVEWQQLRHNDIESHSFSFNSIKAEKVLHSAVYCWKWDRPGCNINVGLNQMRSERLQNQATPLANYRMSTYCRKDAWFIYLMSCVPLRSGIQLLGTYQAEFCTNYGVIRSNK